MAVSPSIVSGRVVATTISPPPSTSYANSKSSPLAPSSLSTSRSLSDVMHSGHQLMRRVARYMRPCSWRRTNASVTARDRSGSIVNFDRDQSGLAPRMRWKRI